MEQFNLDTWLQDKSHKIVTREGKPVRIVCWDSPNKGFPIVGFIDDDPTVFIWDKYGYVLPGHRESNRDLFFAEEEEELTEFEKKLKEVLYEHATTNTSSEEKARQYAPELLDLARKEIEKGDRRNPVGAYKNGYEQGKQDALKDLPKWKKCVGSTGPFIDYNSKGEAYLYLNDYAVKISELEKKLPKSE